MSDITTKKFLDEAGLKKFWELNKQYIESYLKAHLFVGTQDEYNMMISNELLSDGALVILTDGVGIPHEGLIPTESAVLGVAILGQMKLGVD
jgi:hypothetical protein